MSEVKKNIVRGSACIAQYHNALYSSLFDKKIPHFFPLFSILLNRNSRICYAFHYYLHFEDRDVSMEKEGSKESQRESESERERDKAKN